MPTSVSVEGILTPNHTNLVKRFFRLFLDKIKLHTKMQFYARLPTEWAVNRQVSSRLPPSERVSGFLENFKI